MLSLYFKFCSVLQSLKLIYTCTQHICTGIPLRIRFTVDSLYSNKLPCIYFFKAFIFKNDEQNDHLGELRFRWYLLISLLSFFFCYISNCPYTTCTVSLFLGMPKILFKMFRHNHSKHYYRTIQQFSVLKNTDNARNKVSTSHFPRCPCLFSWKYVYVFSKTALQHFLLIFMVWKHVFLLFQNFTGIICIIYFI